MTTETPSVEALERSLADLMRGATWKGATVDDLRARKRAVEAVYNEAIRERDEAIGLLRRASDELRESQEACGGCDHDVGICQCDLDELAARVAAFLSRFPEGGEG